MNILYYQIMKRILFNDKKRSYVLLSITDLLNSLLPDEETQKNIYLSLNNFINNLDNHSWPMIYSFWELNLIKEGVT